MTNMSRYEIELRDKYAGMAMQAACSGELTLPESIEPTAKFAFLMADAMMEQRDRWQTVS